MKFEEIKNEKVIKNILDKLNIKVDMTFNDIFDLIENKIIKNCVKFDNNNVLEFNYIILEIIKRYYILHNFTDLEFEGIKTDDDFKNATEISNWSSKIWKHLIKKINNYELFEELLEKTLNMKLKKFTNIEYKIAIVLDEIAKKIKNTNINNDTITGLISTLTNVTKDIKKD